MYECYKIYCAVVSKVREVMDTSLVTSFIHTVSSGGSSGPMGDHAPVDTSFLYTYSIPIIDGLYDVFNSPRQLVSIFKQLKCCCFLGTWSPDPVSVKIKMFSF